MIYSNTASLYLRKKISSINFLLFFFFFLLLGKLAARQDSIHVFRSSRFIGSHILATERLDTLCRNGTLDHDFYHQNFQFPYLLPNTLINTNFKDTTFFLTIDSCAALLWNPYFTYQYDGLSRLQLYSYSGSVCGVSQPFVLHFYYDAANRLRKIENRLPHSHYKNEKFEVDPNAPSEEVWLYSYDSFGDIIQLQYFTFGHLDLQIDKL